MGRCDALFSLSPRERVGVRGFPMTKPLQLRKPPHPNPLPEGEGTRARVVIITLLLLLGVQLWLIVMPDLGIRHGNGTLIAIAAVLAVILPVARGITRVLDLVVQPSRRAAPVTALVFFSPSRAFLFFPAAPP